MVKIAGSPSALSGRPFWKMNGLGNDFVILDLRGTNIRLSAEEAIWLADRNGPLGCDQVITIETRDGLPFMDIRNADGSPAGACGNAARCVGWLLMQESGRGDADFLTPAGSSRALAIRDNEVSVDMGEPRLHWKEIPLAEQMDDTRFIDIKLGPIDNPVLWGPSAVNMGNPHCVFFTSDIDAHRLDRFGPLIENHPLFPDRANVSLAQVTSRHEILLKVWERGAGLTRACGSAACAALVSAVRRRLTGRKATVQLPGGALAVDWREDDNHVWLAGPVETEFSGTF